MLAGSVHKMEGDHLKILKVIALIYYNAGTLFLNGFMRLETNKLKIHPIGMAT